MIKALAVDDDPIFLRILEAIGTQIPGLELHTVQSPGTALKLLGNREFQLLITDRDLPGISGCELTILAKNLGFVDRTIMLTNRPDCVDCACQPDLRLKKPLHSPQRLQQAIQTVFGN